MSGLERTRWRPWVCQPWSERPGITRGWPAQRLDLAGSRCARTLARSRYFGVHLISEVARAVRRVEGLELGGEQPNLGTEGIARLGAERGQQLGLRRPQAFIEGREEVVALLGGDDSARPPVGRIRAALDQIRRLEVIQQIGHNRTVDSEMLGEGELAPNGALRGGREDLVTPWATRKVGHSGVGRLDIGPKDHPQAPSEVVSQRAPTPRRVPALMTMISGVVHHPIIRTRQRSVVA